MSSIYQDLRYAIRILGAHPGFSLTVVLGIGANVTMLAVVNGLLFAPLPYRDADRLVMVWNRHTTTGADNVQISGLDFLKYKDRATSFETSWPCTQRRTTLSPMKDPPNRSTSVAYRQISSSSSVVNLSLDAVSPAGTRSGATVQGR